MVVRPQVTASVPIRDMRNVALILVTDLFLTEEREDMVKFLWGKRGALEAAGAGAGAGGEVFGRRVPAAAAPAASATTNHHLYITGKARTRHDLQSR